MSTMLAAGHAFADITPHVGAALSGYASRDRGSDALGDPLEAHALVLDDGDRAMALVSVDLLGVTPEVTAQARAIAAAETQLAPEAIAICASHTHFGPMLEPASYLPEALQAMVSRAYCAVLAEKLGGMIAEAWRARVRARLGSGTGWAPGISFNRRPIQADGQTAMLYTMDPEMAAVASAVGAELAAGWLEGERAERLSEPLEGLKGLRAGVTDPGVTVLRVEAEDGAPLCAVVSFACHATCGGANFYAISSDYVGYAREVLWDALRVPTVFLLGCAGDQVPAWREGDSRSRVGQSVGAEALRVWHQIVTSDSVAIATVSRNVQFPLRPLPTLEEARKQLEGKGGPGDAGAAFERHMLALSEQFGGQTARESEMWAAAIGDVGIVGMPGEVFTEIGLAIKAGTPFGRTAPVSLANDYINYFPTRAAYAEGGYEPTWSPNAPEAGERLVEEGLAMMEELKG